MKKILLITFIGLSTLNGYAQNKCNCSCKHKATDHKVAVVRHGASPDRNKLPYRPAFVTVLPHVPNTYVPVPPAPEPCHTYTQHDIVVQECPNTFYDNNGAIQYNGEGTFLGYYPDGKSGEKSENANNDMAPQHTVISNYRGVAPADGNSCNGCQPQ